MQLYEGVVFLEMCIYSLATLCTVTNEQLNFFKIYFSIETYVVKKCIE